MAAILRSSVIQTVRRALSGEGTLSVRALHTGRNKPMAYSSCAKENLKAAEVDSVAGARMVRVLNRSKSQETRVRREAGATRVRRKAGALENLDITLRDMGYITRGPFARYFVLFAVLTIMSEGV